MFKQTPLNLPQLERGNVGGVRKYKTPDGNFYPSVTTVLGATMDDSWLDSWRAAVGDAEANRVMRLSANKGTILHALCEGYVQNKEIIYSKLMPPTLMSFQQVKYVLDKNITSICNVEQSLYSDRLQIAGTADLIAFWDDEIYVIDYKTSRSFKHREDILGYFYQCVLYAYMIWELTNKKYLPKIAIIIACDDYSTALVYTAKAHEFFDDALSLVKQYYKEN